MRINTQKGIAPIAALVIILIIAGGAFLLFKNRAGNGDGVVETSMPIPESETPEMIVENTGTEPAEITVTYDANGFMPKTVTVRKGDTVVFQNKTGKPASVASAVHPTHLLYPEFDQYKTAERGKDEFRFSFEKVGAWKYHDHLNATMTGTVVVE